MGSKYSRKGCFGEICNVTRDSSGFVQSKLRFFGPTDHIYTYFLKSR